MNIYKNQEHRVTFIGLKDKDISAIENTNIIESEVNNSF